MENRKKSIEINFDGITYNDVPFKNWSQKMQEDFIEGFVTNTLGNNNKYPVGSSSSLSSSSHSNNSSNNGSNFNDINNWGFEKQESGKLENFFIIYSIKEKL